MGGTRTPPVDATASTAAGEGGRIAQPAHHRYRDDAGCRHVGRGAAADRAEQAAGQDGDLGRAAPEMPGQRERQIDEETPGAARLQKRTEHDEDHENARLTGASPIRRCRRVTGRPRR